MYIDEETSRLRLIVNWIVDIVVVISVAWFIVFSLGTQITMTGQSMDPVLSQDEVVLMNRLSVRFGKIKRFDIVVFLSLIHIFTAHRYLRAVNWRE